MNSFYTHLFVNIDNFIRNLTLSLGTSNLFKHETSFQKRKQNKRARGPWTCNIWYLIDKRHRCIMEKVCLNAGDFTYKQLLYAMDVGGVFESF